MECEICYESYNEGERAPLILACKCHKIMCQSCVTRRLDSTARCPYCDIRWSVRNYVAQCKEMTPRDTLQKLQLAHLPETESSHTRKHSALGSGELRTYYEQSVMDIRRKAEEKSADQIDEDKNIAKTLQDTLQKEEEEEKQLIREMEERDALLAAKMALSDPGSGISSSSSGRGSGIGSGSSFSFQKGDRNQNHRDFKNSIDKFVAMMKMTHSLAGSRPNL